MSKNYFIDVDRRFSNQQSCVIDVVRFRCEPVHRLLDSLRSVFKDIDFSDDYQRQFGRLLWKFRCTVYFALAPYDAEELGLLADFHELSKMAERLPSSMEPMKLLRQRLIELMEFKENPKLEWVLRQSWPENETSAIFALMAMRRSFGADLVSMQAPNQNIDFEIITSLEHLVTLNCSTLVLPGTLQYLSHNLFMKLFYRGEFKRLCVLVYEKEPLSFKNKIKPPESSLFPGLVGRSELRLINIEGSDVTNAPVCNEGDSSFSQELGSSGLIAENTDNHFDWFLLFDDGWGFYTRENEKIRIWRSDAPEKLAFVYPVQLLEGDFVILERSNRNELLEQLGSNKQFLAELDSTSVWRDPLKAMLLTVSSEEVASQMIATGYLSVTNSDLSSNATLFEDVVRKIKVNVSKWAEGQVFGPRDLNHLVALVQVLVDGGYLNLESSPEHAAKVWFEHLEAIRLRRRSAGVDLNMQTEEFIEKVLQKQSVLNDGQEFALENGMQISIHQLASISEQQSEVAGIFVE